MPPFDISSYNSEAWDRQVEYGNHWTVPVSPELIAEARQGRWSVVLTENVPVPRSWFPDNMKGVDILCLAGAGGQQGPIFAAAGARVTVFDNSQAQLARDRMVADRDGLELQTVQGDMADLSAFTDESFDLVFHPVSNVFAPDPRPVWKEAFRVLRPGGTLLSGFMNPVFYLFDWKLQEQGILSVRYKLPYSDLESLDEAVLKEFLERGQPLEFGHTLEAQIGGQLDAGFLLAGFYEDRHKDVLIGQFTPTYIATRAIKPSR